MQKSEIHLNMIRSTKDLPKWFNLESYEQLYELTDMDLLKQFRYRYGLHESYLGHEEFGLGDFGQNEVWDNITSGTVIILKPSDKYIEEPTFYHSLDFGELTITGCDAIKGINLNFMTDLAFRLDEIGVLKLTESSHEKTYNYDTGLSRYADVNYANLSKSLYLGESVWVDINLGEYTDNELVAVLKSLLPKWRKQMNFEEPDIKIGRASSIRKIATYKIIPYLDLIMWSTRNKVKLPHKVTVAALFPDGEKGEIEFLQTIIPYYKKIMTYGFRWLEEIENKDIKS